MLPERKIQNIVGIDSLRRNSKNPGQPPHPDGPTALSGNKYTRRSFVSMFLLGSGTWKVAKFHKVKPTQVEAELREELIRGGAFNRKAA